jgi:putative Holliday junction resolvase
MRLLGIDYGTKRIGLAMTDPLGIMVQPVSIIHRKSLASDIAEIKNLIIEKEVQKIVLGMPTNMDGTPGILSAQVREFADILTKETNIPVDFCNEGLTSHEAGDFLINKAGISHKKIKAVKDKIAACIILQSYLEKLNRK